LKAERKNYVIFSLWGVTKFKKTTLFADCPFPKLAPFLFQNKK